MSELASISQMKLSISAQVLIFAMKNTNQHASFLRYYTSQIVETFYESDKTLYWKIFNIQNIEEKAKCLLENITLKKKNNEPDKNPQLNYVKLNDYVLFEAIKAMKTIEEKKYIYENALSQQHLLNFSSLTNASKCKHFVNLLVLFPERSDFIQSTIWNHHAKDMIHYKCGTSMLRDAILWIHLPTVKFLIESLSIPYKNQEGKRKHYIDPPIFMCMKLLYDVSKSKSNSYILRPYHRNGEGNDHHNNNMKNNNINNMNNNNNNNDLSDEIVEMIKYFISIYKRDKQIYYLYMNMGNFISDHNISTIQFGIEDENYYNIDKDNENHGTADAAAAADNDGEEDDDDDEFYDNFDENYDIHHLAYLIGNIALLQYIHEQTRRIYHGTYFISAIESEDIKVLEFFLKGFTNEYYVDRHVKWSFRSLLIGLKKAFYLQRWDLFSLIERERLHTSATGFGAPSEESFIFYRSLFEMMLGSCNFDLLRKVERETTLSLHSLSFDESLNVLRNVFHSKDFSFDYLECLRTFLHPEAIQLLATNPSYFLEEKVLFYFYFSAFLNIIIIIIIIIWFLFSF
jgi:hypothetical protein